MKIRVALSRSLSANLPSYDRSCKMQVADNDLENIESLDM